MPFEIVRNDITNMQVDASYVIHAVSPSWKDGSYHEEELLQQTYDRCLLLVQQHNCESIAFPLLASCNHGFSKAKAIQIAVNAFSSFFRG